MLVVEAAVAKVPKYAVLESGDSVEVIERPRGGFSIVIADGQRSGRSAKAISNIAVRKAVSLLAEGVRDGAAARAAHDYLRTQRGGQVSAELTILSVDLETRTLVISRNSRCPVLLALPRSTAAGAEAADADERRGLPFRPAGTGDWYLFDEPAEPVGFATRARPVIGELPLEPGQAVVAFTDGLIHAGARQGAPLDPLRVVAELGCPPHCRAAEMADTLLQAALARDEGRPADDVTVVVLQTLGVPGGADARRDIRRMTVSFPIPLS